MGGIGRLRNFHTCERVGLERSISTSRLQKDLRSDRVAVDSGGRVATVFNQVADPVLDMVATQSLKVRRVATLL